MADVAICTPHGGSVQPEYYRRVLEMQNHSLGHTFYHMELDLQIVGKARNVLVEEVLRQTPCQVLWFIDNDTYIHANSGILIDLALKHGIVSGLYFNRHAPYTPQVYKLSTRSDEVGMYEAILDYPETGMMLVEAVGAGCLAVRRDVFETMKQKHDERLKSAVEHITHELRNDGRARADFEWLLEYAQTLSPWFEFLDKKGEDFYFSERAHDAGFPIFVCVDVKCDHMGPVLIHEGHFKYLKDNNLLVRLDPQGNPIDAPPPPVPPEAPK